MSGRNIASLADDAAGRLRPYFSDLRKDVPERTLEGFPESANVCAALKTFVNVLLGGRYSPRNGGANFLQSLSQELQAAGTALLNEVKRSIEVRSSQSEAVLEADAIVEKFFLVLPEIRKKLLEDIRAAYRGDPAAESHAEVTLAYPGILAVAVYRIAHELWRLHVPLIPRMMSEWAHSETGIDIHPGATIGSGFFVDHGTGVVIGETAVIGNNVKLYQGAILGARSFALDELGNPVKHVKRHPTVEDGVVIYSNAIILGGDTVVGAGSTIGGSVFLTKSVPPNTLVINQPPELKMKTEDPGSYEI